MNEYLARIKKKKHFYRRNIRPYVPTKKFKRKGYFYNSNIRNKDLKKETRILMFRCSAPNCWQIIYFLQRFRCSAPTIRSDRVALTFVEINSISVIKGEEHRNIYQIVTRVIVSLFHKKGSRTFLIIPSNLQINCKLDGIIVYLP